MPEIIEKLKESGLKGRGGAGFAVYQKWQTVLEAKMDKKYIVVNGAEGEPGVKKDHFILENYMNEVIDGLKIGLQTFENSKGYIYLKKEYFAEFGDKLKELIEGLPVKIFEKTGGYLAGEETVIVEAIEGRRQEPSLKPPFPADKGILINNVETWYHIAKVDKGEYKKTRFYTVSGEVKNEGVFEEDENETIKNILTKTNNYPDFDFFVQSGGGTAGEILLPSEIGQAPKGQGAIVIYNREKTDSLTLIKKWVNFFYEENCDKCAPCREGVYRIKEMLESDKFDQQILNDLFYVLENTSFCALGKAVSLPIKSLYEKIGL